jgi:hypothetical protein
MAKISTFKINSRAQKEGEWVPPGEEYGDLEILTRGLTDPYFDAQAARQRRAAVGFNGNVDKLPLAIRRAINLDLLIEHVVLDVRNLEHDDGTKVTFDEFTQMLRDPDYAELATACFAAASQVGKRRATDLEDAAPSSERPSV